MAPTRNFPALTARTFDVLVVGGGIHGLFTAYDAASRGFSVALVERGDFGSGLSFNHQRTVHGGLRAMEGGHLAKAQQQIRERRTWATMAPHLIRPMPFGIATVRGSKRSRWLIRTGFAAYDLVGRSRNASVPRSLHLPQTTLVDRQTAATWFPQSPHDKLTGGAIWFDYQTTYSDRINWLVAVAATKAGATLVNYADALSPLRQGSNVVGARVVDRDTGAAADVRAAITVLAAGSGLPSAMSAFGLAGAPPLLRAMNLLLDRPSRDLALASPGRSGRMLTLVPWAGATLAGTFQSPDFVSGSEIAPPASEIDAMLDDVNSAFPDLSVTRADILMAHHGLTPAVQRRGRAELMPDSKILDASITGVPGVMALVGVKFTTARATAERAVDLVVQTLGRTARACSTADAPLPHADAASPLSTLKGMRAERELAITDDTLTHLAAFYGSEAVRVLEFCVTAGEWERVSPASPVLCGEVAYAVHHSMAQRLTDVVVRRTRLGTTGHPGRTAIARAADVMARAAVWTEDRRLAEIEDVEAFYRRIFSPDRQDR